MPATATKAAKKPPEIRQIVSPVVPQDWISMHRLANAVGGGGPDDWKTECEKRGIEIRETNGIWPFVRREDVEKLVGPHKARAVLLDDGPDWYRRQVIGQVLGIQHAAAAFVIRLRGVMNREGGGGTEASGAEVAILRRNLGRESQMPVEADDWVPADGIESLLDRAINGAFVTSVTDDELYAVDPETGTPRHNPYTRLIMKLGLITGIRWKTASTVKYGPRQLLVNAFDLYRLAGVLVDPDREEGYIARLEYAAGDGPIA